VNISECFDFLQFWINKSTGAWFAPQQLIDVIDRGQIAVFADFKPKYATSQYIKDALSPFRATYDFTPSNTVSGYIVVPSNSDYLDLLDIQITYSISNRTVYFPIDMVNEDERANRLNSQIDPVTVTSPIGEQTAPRYFRLYPLSGYTGTVTYFKRPIKPVFAYSTISGRVIVYDPINSVQLEWRETEIDFILIKALQSIGINLSSADLAQWAEVKSAGNFSGVNKL